MLPDENSIKKNCETVFSIINRNQQGCKFMDLQSASHIENIDLCMALIYLLRHNRISQKWSQNGVFYCSTES